MSLRLMLNDAEQVGDGSSPRGQYGREHQHARPVIGEVGKARALHKLGHAWWWTFDGACVCLAARHVGHHFTIKDPISQPSHHSTERYKGQSRAKSALT